MHCEGEINLTGVVVSIRCAIIMETVTWDTATSCESCNGFTSLLAAVSRQKQRAELQLKHTFNATC